MIHFLRRIAERIGLRHSEPGPAFAAVLQRCVRETDPVTFRVGTLQRTLIRQTSGASAIEPARPNERN